MINLEGISRDRLDENEDQIRETLQLIREGRPRMAEGDSERRTAALERSCLLYTSDAADE